MARRAVLVRAAACLALTAGGLLCVAPACLGARLAHVWTGRRRGPSGRRRGPREPCRTASSTLRLALSFLVRRVRGRLLLSASDSAPIFTSHRPWLPSCAWSWPRRVRL